MSSPQPIAFNEGTVHPHTDAWEFQYAGPWQLVYGGTSLQTGLEIEGLETNVQVRVQYQLAATNPKNPETPEGTNVGTTYTADGREEDTFDVSEAGDYLWIRAIVYAKLSTSSAAPATAFCRLWSMVLGAGWVVGRARVVMEPGTNTVVVPVGAPFAAANVAAVKLGVTFRGVVSGITDPNAAYRTFTVGNPDWPSTWTTGTNTTDAAQGNSKVNYEQATTTANALLVQAGFEFSTTSAQYGVAEIIVVAKKA